MQTQTATKKLADVVVGDGLVVDHDGSPRLVDVSFIDSANDGDVAVIHGRATDGALVIVRGYLNDEVSLYRQAEPYESLVCDRCGGAGYTEEKHPSYGSFNCPEPFVEVVCRECGGTGRA